LVKGKMFKAMILVTFVSVSADLANAQQPAATTGLRGSPPDPDRVFRQGLRDLGYVEERTRDRVPMAEGRMNGQISQPTWSARVDVIVVGGNAATRAARGDQDDSYRHASGVRWGLDLLPAWRGRWKYHGLSYLFTDLSGKRLSFSEALPKVSRVGLSPISLATQLKLGNAGRATNVGSW
jgi:hypothetical protein